MFRPATLLLVLALSSGLAWALDCKSTIDLIVVSSSTPFDSLSSEAKPDSSYKAVFSVDGKEGDAPIDINSGSGGVFQYLFATDVADIRLLASDKGSTPDCPSGFDRSVDLSPSQPRHTFLCLRGKARQSVKLVSTPEECKMVNEKYQSSSSPTELGSHSADLAFSFGATELGLCAVRVSDHKPVYICQKTLPKDLAKSCKRYVSHVVGVHNFKHAFATRWPSGVNEREQNCLLFTRRVLRPFGPLIEKPKDEQKRSEVVDALKRWAKLGQDKKNTTRNRHYSGLPFHDGIDLDGRVALFGEKAQASVVAVADGEISHIDACQINEQLGCSIVIDHGKGFSVSYGHLNLVRPAKNISDAVFCPSEDSLAKCGFTKLKVGQKVKAGEALGLAGSNGDATLPQIHLTAYHKSHLMLVKTGSAEGAYDYVWSDHTADTPWGRHRDFCDCGTPSGAFCEAPAEAGSSSSSSSSSSSASVGGVRVTENRRVAAYDGKWLRVCRSDPKPLSDADCLAEPKESCKGQKSGSCYWDGTANVCKSIYARVQQTSAAFCKPRTRADCADDFGVCRFDRVRSQCVPVTEFRRRMKVYMNKAQELLNKLKGQSEQESRRRVIQQIAQLLAKILSDYESARDLQAKHIADQLKEAALQLQREQSLESLHRIHLQRQQAELERRWGQLLKQQKDLADQKKRQELESQRIQRSQQLLKAEADKQQEALKQREALKQQQQQEALKQQQQQQQQQQQAESTREHTESSESTKSESSRSESSRVESSQRAESSDYSHHLGGSLSHFDSSHRSLSSSHRSEASSHADDAEIADDGPRDDEGHDPIVQLAAVEVDTKAHKGKVPVHCPQGFKRIGKDLHQSQRGSRHVFLCVKRGRDHKAISDLEVSHSQSCPSQSQPVLSTSGRPANFHPSKTAILCAAHSGKQAVNELRTLGKDEHEPSGWKAVGSESDGIHIAYHASKLQREHSSESSQRTKPHGPKRPGQQALDPMQQQQHQQQQALALARQHRGLQAGGLGGMAQRGAVQHAADDDDHLDAMLESLDF